MPITQFRVVTDPNSLVAVRQWPDYVDNRVLAAGASEEVTPPAGAKMVIITPDQDTWLKKNAVATVPAADVTNGAGQILCPAGMPTAIGLDAIVSFGMICAVASLSSLEYFA